MAINCNSWDTGAIQRLTSAKNRQRDALSPQSSALSGKGKYPPCKFSRCT